MKKPTLFLITFVFLMIWAGGCTASTPAPTDTPVPTNTSAPTNTPAPTLTPTLSPHSLVVIKSTLTGDVLYVLIQDTDSDGEKLDALGLGFLCLGQGIYAIDEGGSQLECVQLTDLADGPNQIAITFSGASSEHSYQLVRGEDAPIELLLEQLNP